MGATADQVQAGAVLRRLAEMIDEGLLDVETFHLDRTVDHTYTATVRVQSWAALDQWSRSLGHLYAKGNDSTLLAEVAATPVLVTCRPAS